MCRKGPHLLDDGHGGADVIAALVVALPGQLQDEGARGGPVQEGAHGQLAAAAALVRVTALLRLPLQLMQHPPLQRHSC